MLLLLLLAEPRFFVRRDSDAIEPIECDVKVKLSPATDWAFASDHNVAFMRAMGAPSIRGTVQRAAEEMCARIKAGAVDVEIAKVFAHGGRLATDPSLPERWSRDRESADKVPCDTWACVVEEEVAAQVTISLSMKRVKLALFEEEALQYMDTT